MVLIIIYNSYFKQYKTINSSSYSHSIHRVMSTLHYIKPCKNCKLLYKSEPKLLTTNTCRIRTRLYILILKIMKCKIKLRFLVHTPKNLTSNHFLILQFFAVTTRNIHNQSTRLFVYHTSVSATWTTKKKNPNRPSSAGSENKSAARKQI